MERKWWTLLAVCTGVFMLLLDVTIVNVALPDIQAAFGASLAQLQWVIDAYALTLAALLLTAGSIADLVGRRRVFAVGLGVFAGGSLLCGLSGGATFLSLARALQGVGGAILFATSLALLAQAFAPPERGVAFGVFGAVTGIGVAIGPVLGGAITSGLSWRWIFFVNLPFAAFALAVTLLRVEESRDPRARRPDWLGFLTFSTGLALLVLGLIRSHAHGWGSSTVVGSLALAALLLSAFVVVEARVRHPMLDLSLLRVPTFDGVLVAAWAISASVISLLTYLVIYLQRILGYSALGAGLRMLPFTGALFLASGIAGRLSSRVPTRLLIAPGFLLAAVGLFLLRGLDPGDGWTELIPGLILAGAGAGLINVPLASTAVGVVEPERAGMASGINSTFRQLGVATGVAALGSILADRLQGSVVGRLGGGPLASHAARIASQVSEGRIAQVLGATPPALRGAVADAAQTGYADGLDKVLLIAAILALAAAVLTAALIRPGDLASRKVGRAANGRDPGTDRRMPNADRPTIFSANQGGTMKITIFGATGGVGRSLVEQALAAGEEVTAVARYPERLPDGVRGVRADLSSTKPLELGPALDGADAVISVIGPRSKDDVGISSRGTKAIIAAMKMEGTRRLVVISAAPIATVASPRRPKPPRRDPGDGFFVANVLTPIVKRAFGYNYTDLALMEDAVRASGLDWTIVRPPRMTDKPPTGTYRTASDKNLRGGLSIPRGDVAHFMLAAPTLPETVGQTVRVAS